MVSNGKCNDGVQDNQNDIDCASDVLKVLCEKTLLLRLHDNVAGNFSSQ